MRDAMIEFIAQNTLCVISTVSESAMPESAFVGFSSSKNLEIIVGTSRKSRKYKNIQHNPAVAIVIADTTAEIQYEGQASEVADSEYSELIEGQHFKKLPGAAKYREDPDQVYLKISPQWIRFTKHEDTNLVEEFTEFA